MLMPRFDSVRLTNLTRAVLVLAGLVTFGSSGASQSTAIVDQANAPALQLAQVSTADRTSATPTRRALLIGVGEHLYNKVPDDRKRMGKKKSFPEDLGGAVNDVEIIKDVLIRRFGFKPENIVTLTDSQATREAILAAMRQIVEDAGPEDVVHIHFSGHGSWIKDMNGDEKDKFDETLLPYDARTDKVRDITDDEINAILSGLRARDTLVTLDACHSGTATRGESDVMIRGGEPDPMTELYGDVSARGQALGRDALVDASETILPETEAYTLMTGAAAEHSALDSPIDSEKRYGWFSWSLANTLGTVDQNMSTGEVFFEIQRKMQSVGEKKGHRAPMPQLEATDGARARPLLAGGDIVAGEGGVTQRTWVTADPAGEGKIVLRMGPLYGAVEGSLWAIYPPATKDFSGTPQIGTAVVKSRGGEDSRADLEVTGTIEPGSRAVMVAQSWRENRLRVRLGKMTDQEEKDFVKAIRATRIGSKFLQVGDEEASRYVVDMTDGEVRIFSSGRLTEIESFPFVDMGSTATRAASVFERPIKLDDLLALENPDSKIKLDFAVRPLDEDGDPRVRTVGGESLPAYRVWDEDSGRTTWNSMMMEVTADKDVYLTILEVNPDGELSIMFPNSVSKDMKFYPKGRIAAGEQVRIPDSLSEGTLTAGFFIDLKPPLGVYQLRAFIATDLPTAISIREYIGEYGVAQQALERDELYRREQMANQGESGVSARGEIRRAGGTKPKPDWTAATVRYLVEE